VFLSNKFIPYFWYLCVYVNTQKNIKGSLDESELGILFHVMTRLRFMFFSILFALIERILSLVNHVKTKPISPKQWLLRKGCWQNKQRQEAKPAKWHGHLSLNCERYHTINGVCRQRYINVLSNGNVIQTFMFTLHMKIWKRNYT